MTECGTVFMAKELRKFLNKDKIRHKAGPPFHHQTPGTVERVINIFMNKRRKLAEFKKDKWRRDLGCQPIIQS